MEVVETMPHHEERKTTFMGNDPYGPWPYTHRQRPRTPRATIYEHPRYSQKPQTPRAERSKTIGATKHDRREGKNPGRWGKKKGNLHSAHSSSESRLTAALIRR